jgi:hypothetical protein
MAYVKAGSPPQRFLPGNSAVNRGAVYFGSGWVPDWFPVQIIPHFPFFCRKNSPEARARPLRFPFLPGDYARILA